MLVPTTADAVVGADWTDDALLMEAGVAATVEVLCVPAVLLRVVAEIDDAGDTETPDGTDEVAVLAAAELVGALADTGIAEELDGTVVVAVPFAVAPGEVFDDAVADGTTVVPVPSADVIVELPDDPAESEDCTVLGTLEEAEVDLRPFPAFDELS